MRYFILFFVFIVLSAAINAKPGSFAYTRVDFMLTLSDGIKLDCTKFIPTGSPPAGGWPCALIAHGYGLTKFSEMPDAEDYASNGYYSFVYSMRGQGVSEGLSNFISMTEANDLKQVVVYMKNDINHLKD